MSTRPPRVVRPRRTDASQPCPGPTPRRHRRRRGRVRGGQPLRHPAGAGRDASAQRAVQDLDTGDIQLRLYRQDWQNVNQANDYSFNGADTNYAVNTNVAAYVGGALAFGTAPAGGSPTTTTTTTTTTQPSGAALFDDFHYGSS